MMRSAAFYIIQQAEEEEEMSSDHCDLLWWLNERKSKINQVSKDKTKRSLCWNITDIKRGEMSRFVTADRKDHFSACLHVSISNIKQTVHRLLDSVLFI